MQLGQSQEQELAPHQHRQEVDGIVMANPQKQRLAIRVHAQVIRRFKKYLAILTFHHILYVCNHLSKQTLAVIFVFNSKWRVVILW